MNIRADAHGSKIVSKMQQNKPLLRATALGDERLIGFISLQAALPGKAELVVRSLEEQIHKGYTLDVVLSGILRKAKTTVRESRSYRQKPH